MLGISLLIAKFTAGIHGELLYTAFGVCSPEDVEYGCSGLKKMRRCWVSRERSDVIASFWNGRRIIIGIVGLEPVHLREVIYNGIRDAISSLPNRVP